MLFLWCCLVAVGSWSLTEPDVLPKGRETRLLPRDHSRKENSTREQTLLSAVCGIDEKSHFSVELCRENKHHPQQLPSRRKLPGPWLCQLLDGVICSPSSCILCIPPGSQAGCCCSTEPSVLLVSPSAVLLLCFPFPSFALPQLQFKENTHDLPRRTFWHRCNLLNTAIKIFFILTWK